MITVKIVLDQRSVKKDGTSPLKLRLLYYRKSNQISLGYSILAKDWDARKERIKSSCQILEEKLEPTMAHFEFVFMFQTLIRTTYFQCIQSLQFCSTIGNT